MTWAFTASGDALSADVFIPAEFMPELATVVRSGGRGERVTAASIFTMILTVT
jgi:hypothetical protein